MHEASAYAWFNGEIVKREEAAPSISSVSLHLGVGVFDGIMAYWNGDHYYYHRAKDHLARFCANSGNMSLNFRWSPEELEVAMYELMERLPRTTYYIRPVAYRGQPQIFLTGSEARPADVCIFGVPVSRDNNDPLTYQLSSVERLSHRSFPVSWKACGSYVNSYLARRRAEAEGYNDALMLDREGRISEASAANVFFIRGERLYTPRLSGDVFPGITRSVVMEIAAANGLTCEEGDLSPRDLDRFEGLFVCSTLMEIRPVVKLSAQALDTPNHPTFQMILKGFRELTHG